MSVLKLAMRQLVAYLVLVAIKQYIDILGCPSKAFHVSGLASVARIVDSVIAVLIFPPKFVCHVQRKINDRDRLWEGGRPVIVCLLINGEGERRRRSGIGVFGALDFGGIDYWL